jgi:hypothetical protein
MKTRYPRDHQRALGVAQPVSVLWAALKAALPAEEVRKVEEAYRVQARRYQRACELNKMARWVERNDGRALRADDRAKLERRRAALAEPMKYVEGE